VEAVESYIRGKVRLARQVEASGETADGKPFADIDDYKQLILRDRDQIARNVAEKLVIYATCARLQFADRQVIDRIVGTTRKDNPGLRSILHEVVQSRLFRHK